MIRKIERDRRKHTSYRFHKKTTVCSKEKEERGDPKWRFTRSIGACGNHFFDMKRKRAPFCLYRFTRRRFETVKNAARNNLR